MKLEAFKRYRMPSFKPRSWFMPIMNLDHQYWEGVTFWEDHGIAWRDDDIKPVIQIERRPEDQDWQEFQS